MPEFMPGNHRGASFFLPPPLSPPDRSDRDYLVPLDGPGMSCRCGNTSWHGLTGPDRHDGGDLHQATVAMDDIRRDYEEARRDH